MRTNPVLYMWQKQEKERVKYDRRSRVNTLPFYEEYTKENNFDNNLKNKNINEEGLLPKGVLSNRTDNIKIFIK